MDTSLYPLKFEPILKERIWGGQRLKTVLGKNTNIDHCGESWELSGVSGDVSVVANGFLKQNNLQELVEIYMGDLVGDKIYEHFGIEFPILIKFIDTQEDLSIQVHPDDALADKRHHSCGKTEMWYVMEADQNSELILGFQPNVDRKIYLDALNHKRLSEIVNRVKITKGDTFFIPTGTVHAIGKNVLLTEIQQTSDLTYRIYDWDRVDAKGKSRELHTELALDAIDYHARGNKISYQKMSRGTAELVQCPYFTTNIIHCIQPLEKDYHALDSFVVYICTSGKCTIRYAQEGQSEIHKGETVLLPAIFKNVQLIPSEPTELLEIYIV